MPLCIIFRVSLGDGQQGTVRDLKQRLQAQMEIPAANMRFALSPAAEPLGDDIILPRDQSLTINMWLRRHVGYYVPVPGDNERQISSDESRRPTQSSDG